jgi:hypothetical protein
MQFGSFFSSSAFASAVPKLRCKTKCNSKKEELVNWFATLFGNFTCTRKQKTVVFQPESCQISKLTDPNWNRTYEKFSQNSVTKNMVDWFITLFNGQLALKLALQ